MSSLFFSTPETGALNREFPPESRPFLSFVRIFTLTPTPSLPSIAELYLGTSPEGKDLGGKVC